MKNYDGEVVIGTDIDDSGFDKALDELDDKIKKFEEKSKIKDLTPDEEAELDKLYEQYNEIYEKDLERSRLERKIIDETREQEESVEQVINKLKEGNRPLYDMIKKLEEMVNQYEQLTQGKYIYESDLRDAEALKQDILEIVKQVEKLTGGEKLHIKGINDLPRSTEATKMNLNDISKGLNNVIKKVTRWSLAVFGLRGAYMMVRNAINTITQQDEQLKANIDYIKMAMAYTLEPLARTIVNLVKELMLAIQHIAYILTGKNIFANANKNLKSAVGSAKELNKQMAPWDEMTVLGGSSGSGGSSATMPDFDLTKMNELSATGQGLVGVILALAGAIGAMKLSELLKTLGLINGQLTIMQGLGIFGLILSIYNIVKDLQEIWEKFDSTVEGNNTTLGDWGDVLKWVGIGIASIGLILGGLPAIIIGVLVAIVALIMKYWAEIRTFVTEKVFGWIDKQIERLEKTTFGRFFANILRDIKLKIAEAMSFLDGTFKRIKQFLDGVTKLFKGDTSGWRDIFGGLLNGIIDKINKLIRSLNTIKVTIPDWVPNIGGKSWGVNIKTIPRLAKGGIINMPGRGVPVGNAYAGERGAEGIIPLTDSQQMALLGETIGRYVTINATIPVYAYNRVVDKQIKRIKAEDDFAYNR